MRFLSFALPFSAIFLLLFSFLPENELSIKIIPIADGLTGPVAMDSPKDGSGRIFICEQKGRIKILKKGEIQQNLFLDISDKLDKINPVYSEKGLLGIAFHPDYKNNGRFYIYYSAASSATGSDHKSIIAGYKVSSNADIADHESEKIILEVEQPEANHNGGQLAFGPDGFLYIGLGDGGGAGDEHGTSGNSQDLNSLLGKILRIDVSKFPYSVPPDNPFVKKNAKPEIWSYGFRNPWRFSFDRKTGELFCGDVGQNKWEEIDIVEKGKNYGWRIMEGNHCYNPKENCNRSGLQLPIAEYGHDEGISVTAGFVYRGKNSPSLQGKYIFADWQGKLFYLEKKGEKWNLKNPGIEGKKNNDSGLNINSFGEDENGELYFLGQKMTGTIAANGGIYKITEAGEKRSMK